MKNKNIIFGTRPVLEAIKSGKTIERIFVQKNTNKDIFYSIGMRYGNPSIASELKNFQDIGIDNFAAS